MFHVEISNATDALRYIDEKYKASPYPYSWESRQCAENVIRTLQSNKKNRGVDYILVDEDEVTTDIEAAVEPALDLEFDPEPDDLEPEVMPELASTPEKTSIKERETFVFKNAKALGGTMSTRELADATGVSATTINNIIAVYAKHSPEMEKRIQFVSKEAKIFGGTKTQKQIADKLGVSEITISRCCDIVRLRRKAMVNDLNPSAPAPEQKQEESVQIEKPVLIKETELLEKPTPVEQPEAIEKPAQPARLAEIIDALNTLKNAASELPALIEESEAVVKEEEVNVRNLLHNIETSDFSDEQARDACNRLKESGIRRKQAEDAVSALRVIQSVTSQLDA